MSIVLGRGQCGAHITLLFTIDDSSEDPVYQGSRGAGICLKDGVEAIAKGDNGSGEIIVRFKDGEYDSRMYQDVLSELMEEIPEIGDFDWELDIIMSLPTSQGFGMSASGAVGIIDGYPESNRNPPRRVCEKIFSRCPHRRKKAI